MQQLARSMASDAEPLLRQRVVATAAVYFWKFYLRRSFCRADPRLIAPACLFLASKTGGPGLQAACCKRACDQRSCSIQCKVSGSKRCRNRCACRALYPPAPTLRAPAALRRRGDAHPLEAAPALRASPVHQARRAAAA